MDDAAKAKRALIIEIDPAELAVGMCEAAYQIKRPAGKTARQALDAMEPECRAGWLRAATFAGTYVAAQIESAAGSASYEAQISDVKGPGEWQQ